jgi:serine/threonine protein kinase
MSESTFLAPKRFDEYRLLRPLGEGTMGQVVLCMDTALYRRVAVKFLKAVELDPSQKERFWIEARAIARLSHPNIVTIYRVGQFQGTPYLVSEFIEGQSLDRLPRPLPWDKVLPIALGIAKGLDAAHRAGVLHRDIKPANIMLTSRGEVKLLDFGLAKVVDNLAGPDVAGGSQSGLFEASGGSIPPAGSMTETLPPPTDPGKHDSGRGPHFPPSDALMDKLLLTAAGVMVGTPLYMSPEAWRGEPATARGDVYSLGVVLFELLTGQPPHKAPNCTALREMVLARPAPSILSIAPTIEPRLATLVDRCLRPMPEERFSSAQDLLHGLQQLSPQESLSSAGSSRRRWLVGGIAGAAVGAFAWGSVFLNQRAHPSGTVVLGPSTFVLGSVADEIESAKQWCRQEGGPECGAEESALFDREQPTHRVHLGAFRIDRTEVTNADFAAWLNKLSDLRIVDHHYVYQGTTLITNLYPRYSPANGIVLNRATNRYEVPRGNEYLPVNIVTWVAAQRYCVDHGMRLPTEAEWEFAARGAEGRRFPWGFESPQCDRLNVARTGNQSCKVQNPNTRSVGSSPQDVTPDGVYDLAGNVPEWVADEFVDSYPTCPEPCDNPLIQVNASKPRQRVIRGGGLKWPLWSTRATARSRWSEDEATATVGFRCASSIQ